MATKETRPYIPYVVPFALFLILTYLASLFEDGVYILYPIKTIAAGLLLILYRKHYTEIKPKFSLLAIIVGLIVFVIWVLPEGLYPQIGRSALDPYTLGRNRLAYTLIAFRLFGASIVVPILEELFWRSFLIRYLISPDFKKVPIGKFTWLSFIATVLLFGFEHHRWLVGIAAGVIYNGLLYYRKDLLPCIIAHAVTNFVLGVYVLYTHQWSFW